MKPHRSTFIRGEMMAEVKPICDTEGHKFISLLMKKGFHPSASCDIKGFDIEKILCDQYEIRCERCGVKADG
jgi:hypothetical protein